MLKERKKEREGEGGREKEGHANCPEPSLWWALSIPQREDTQDCQDEDVVIDQVVT